MQVNDLNFKTYQLYQKGSIKERGEVNFADFLKQEEQKNEEKIDSWEELKQFVWDKRMNAITEEEGKKYQNMLLHIASVEFGVAMGEAMKKQDITCPQDMNIELFKEARREVRENNARFKDYMQSGIELLERGAIIYSNDGTDPETPTEFKANIEGTKDLLRSILKNL